jgi:hypothetical protein
LDVGEEVLRPEDFGGVVAPGPGLEGVAVEAVDQDEAVLRSQFDKRGRVTSLENSLDGWSQLVLLERIIELSKHESLGHVDCMMLSGAGKLAFWCLNWNRAAVHGILE